MSLADTVVTTTLDTYARLPRHGKPTVRDNGIPEWTILASISLVIGFSRVLPIALGTGVKVLPAARLPPLGDTIHDCHAEVLARRGFVRWLLAEADRVIRKEENEGVITWDGTAFRLKPEVQVWLYVSALPVGVGLFNY